MFRPSIEAGLEAQVSRRQRELYPAQSPSTPCAGPAAVGGTRPPRPPLGGSRAGGARHPLVAGTPAESSVGGHQQAA